MNAPHAKGSPTDEQCTFVDACLAGEATADDVDDRVDRWHYQNGRPRGHLEHLHMYLGLDWEEYSVWVSTPSLLGDIVAHRQQSPRHP